MRLTIFIFLLVSIVSFGQELRQTHFFFNPLIDVNEDNFVEAGMVANQYRHSSKENFGVKGNYNLKVFTISAELGFHELLSADFEPSILQIGGRYNFVVNSWELSVGSLLNLTKLSSFHDDDYFSAFTATRYTVNNNLELSASFILGPSINFDDLYSSFGFGAVTSLSSKLNLIAKINCSISEINIDIGAGLEYDISKMFNIRAGYFINRYDGEVNSLYVGLVYKEFNF